MTTPATGASKIVKKPINCTSWLPMNDNIKAMKNATG
jgi:hypothetical protein